MPDDDRPRVDVPRVLAEVSDLRDRLRRAYESGDAAAVDRLVSELSAAERRRNPGGRAARAARAGSW